MLGWLSHSNMQLVLYDVRFWSSGFTTRSKSFQKLVREIRFITTCIAKSFPGVS
jgi:hypothetical protein